MESETSERCDRIETEDESRDLQNAVGRAEDDFSEFEEKLENLASESGLKNEENEFLWQAELDGNSDLEIVSMTKRKYFSFCNEFHNGLQFLLTDKPSSVYATFSKLFKKFRISYLHSQRLKGKVHELETVKRYLENKNSDLLQKLDKRDEEERELRISYMTIRNAIAETVKEKNDIEKQRDEMKGKLSQIPEEIFQAAAKFSLTTASEEKKLLTAKIEDLKEKMSMLEEDLKFSQKRESLFRSKYQDEKIIQSSFKDEIISYKRDLMIQMQLRENAELLVLEKNNEIQKKASTIKHLEKNIVAMKGKLEREKEYHERLFKSLQKFKKLLSESEHTIGQQKNELATRQFQLAVIEARKRTLEQDVKTKHAEIHSLKLEISRLGKERNQISRSFKVAEEDFKRLKADYEKSQQTIKKQSSEKEQLEKERILSENDFKDAVKQMMKIAYEYRLAKGVIRELQSDLKILELNYESVSKDLSIQMRENEEMKVLVERNREEKNKLNKDITDLKNIITALQDRIKAVQQRMAECDSKIFQLEEEIGKEKEQYKFLNDVYRETATQYRNAKQEVEDRKYLNSMVSRRNKSQMFQITKLVERQDKLEKQIISLNINVKNARSALVEQHMCNMKLSEELRQKEREKLCILKDVSDRKIEMRAFQRELDSILSERKLLRSQLEEKMKETKEKDQTTRFLQQDNFRLEQMLHDRINDIKLLKTEIENLRRTEAILESRKNDTENLRAEINDIHRQLVEEKLKSKTMEEEFQKPQNIHRWRIIGAKDSTRAHLLARNLKYQKDLVKKTDQLKNKEQELEDKNRMVTELQQDLKKLTEAKSKGDVWARKKELRECKERIKCLTAEVAMYNNLTSKQEIENKGLQSEINKLKVLIYRKKLTSKELSE